MNARVLVVFALTIVAVVVLALFTFGPLRTTSTYSVNPTSLKPRQTQQVAISTYENRDRKENYYGLGIPADWHVISGGVAGSYVLAMQGASGSIELMDVPDTSTLELFVLSQEEPKLKKSLKEYKRVDYKTLTLNGSSAYQLTYQHTLNGSQVEAVRTYVTGQDMANVMTFTSPLGDFPRLQPKFSSVQQSFHWLPK